MPDAEIASGRWWPASPNRDTNGRTATLELRQRHPELEESATVATLALAVVPLFGALSLVRTSC